MASRSVSLDQLRSPLENVLQILPQGHDKALKQAFYNTAATLFVVFVGAAALAAYYILEVFLRPLLWAVLCGTVLHPFKKTLTNVVRGWLYQLRTSGTPFVVGTILLPFNVLDIVSSGFGGFVVRQSKLIVAVGTGLPAVYILYHFGPLGRICSILRSVFEFVYNALGYFSAIWVWTLVLAYLLVVIFYWTPESSRILRPLSIPVWIALTFHLTTIVGVFRVPLLMILGIMMIVGWMSSEPGQEEESGEDASTHRWWFMPSWLKVKAADEGEEAAETAHEAEPETLRPTVDEAVGESARSETGGSTEQETETRSLSDHCFVALLWAVMLVQLWQRLWLIQLIPLLLFYLLLKKLGVQLGTRLREKMSNIGCHFKDSLSNNSRIGILVPRPMRSLGRMVLRGDGRIVSTLENSMDKTVSIFIILFLMFGLILGTFFSAVQVHRESMHIVSITSNLLNNTLHPDLNQYLPDQKVMRSTVDSMVGNAYLYGREWLSTKIKSIVNGDDSRKAELETQALELWDRLYENWFARNTSTTMLKPHQGANVPLGVFHLSNLTNMWLMMKRTTDFNLDLIAFARENIGVLLSLLESVWLVLKGNINLAITLVTTGISFVLGGGTALLNFIISIVIFITTLFYLLASSGDQYKPVEWFTSISPTQGASGNKFGQAVEEAIGSVFMASFKMAAFYGLYTWLTHTIFAVQIVFIPSAIAAIFAAIPFVGTYWAAFPAIIQLWLVNGQSVQALLLLVCHMLPTYVVDTAILSEIKGGHPYLTGLAIAGGMYWLGLEGAIIGPIVLCCLVVAVNVYSTMLSPDVTSVRDQPPGSASGTFKVPLGPRGKRPQSLTRQLPTT